MRSTPHCTRDSRAALPRWRLLAVLIAIVLAITAHAWAASPDDAPAGSEDLVGKQVNVQLWNGKTLLAMTIEEVVPGKIPGSVLRMQVFDSSGTLRRTWGAAMIEQVLTTGGKCLLVSDRNHRLLLPPEAAGPDAKAPTRREANEAKHRTRLQKKGVPLWPELSDEEQRAETEERRMFLSEVARHFATPGRTIDVQETKYFVVLYSEAGVVDHSGKRPVFNAALDATHEALCKLYGVVKWDKVWLGKAAVFIDQAGGWQFVEFEKRFFNLDVPRSVLGVAHSLPDGSVVISCHYEVVDPLRSLDVAFRCILVHEATHGFNRRFMSACRLPNWLDEGIAECITAQLVPEDDRVKRRTAAAIAEARRTGTLGEGFFTAPNIAAEQYGLATAMVDFLIRSDPKAFRLWIEDVKSGRPWEIALKKWYHVTPAQLTQQFGVKVLGIPSLRP